MDSATPSQHTVPATNGLQRIILFDGVCTLCNRSVQFVIRHDKEARFRFAALDSPVAVVLLKDYALPRKALDAVVYLRQGKAHTRSSAALYIAKDLGGVWRLLSVFLLVPRPIRDLMYDVIAKYRYRWFGKQDSCMVPTAELQGRSL